MKAVIAIKRYFTDGSQRDVTLNKEIMELGHDDRQELGQLACAELGTEFEPTEPK